MPLLPDLRSPYDKLGRLVYVGRMLDKIRLHAAGTLPPDYAANLGDSNPRLFDGRCCRFLGIAYPELVTRTLAGGTDEEILAWIHAHGTPRSDEDCVIWNAYMTKLGWRDEVSDRLRLRLTEYGFAGRGIETFFDLIEADEGRPFASS